MTKKAPPLQLGSLKSPEYGVIKEDCEVKQLLFIFFSVLRAEPMFRHQGIGVLIGQTAISGLIADLVV